MKGITQFQMMVDDKVDIHRKLAELETLIAIARKVIDHQIFRNKDPEPLKFVEHDYDLVLGDFGIDFLHRQDAARAGDQTYSSAGASVPDFTGGINFSPP